LREEIRDNEIQNLKTANGKYSRIAKRNLRFVKSSGQIDGKDMTVQVNRIEVFPCEISKLQMGIFCYMCPCVGIGRGIFLECSEVFGMARTTSSHVCSTGRNSKNQWYQTRVSFYHHLLLFLCYLSYQRSSMMFLLLCSLFHVC
jgi:hypothetical protein